MQQRQLGNNLSVSALGLGCMGMSEFYGAVDDKESMAVLHKAVELGVNFLDTADIYGPHHNEELLSRFLKECQQPLTIATKFGIVREPGVYKRVIDNSASYANAACEASMKRLGVNYIDLYYVHRMDETKPIEEVMEALASMVKEGKIGHIGLCEVSADTLRRAHKVHPVTAVQTEYSIWAREVEEDMLPTCRELEVGFVPYSPLGRGFLTGTFDTKTSIPKDDFRASLPRFSAQNIDNNLAIVKVVREIAEEKACTPAQVALAWLLSKGDDIVPIPGTKRLRYLEENVASTEVSWTEQDTQTLESRVNELDIVGNRYTDEGMKGIGV